MPSASNSSAGGWAVKVGAAAMVAIPIFFPF